MDDHSTKRKKRVQTKCCVPGCINRKGMASTSFHSLPKADHLRKIWLQRIHRPNWRPKSRVLVCSNHFSEMHYKTFKSRDRLHGSCIFKTRNSLKKSAVPDRNLNIQENDEINLSDTCELSLHSSTASEESLTFPEGDFDNVNSSTAKQFPTFHDHDYCGNTGISFQHPYGYCCIHGSIEHSTTDTPTRGKPHASTPCGSEIGDVEHHFLATSPIQSLTELSNLYQLDNTDESRLTVPNNTTDFTYYPSVLIDDNEEGTTHGTQHVDKVEFYEERKFIVFESALHDLIKYCNVCLAPIKSINKQTSGSLLTLKIKCMADHETTWNSQPSLGKRPWGNVLLSAAILFSGSLPHQALRFLQFMGIQAISCGTYFRIQKSLLLSSVMKVWETEKDQLIKDLQGKDVYLAGDGRSDSMGHSAKYGTYTSFELNDKKIIDIQVVQSNEVKSSSHMEQEGLRRALVNLCDKQLNIKEIVTDRHLSITSFLRNEYPDITHYFDIWHLGKAVKKKILSAAKEKDCEILNDWLKSIINHLYWSVMSSDGNSDLVIAKWISLLNHIANIHRRHDSILFKRCVHEKLKTRRKWIKKGTTAHEKLTKIIDNTRILNDIKKLSPKFQTYMVEAFHALLIRFCPKASHFSYNVMEVRTTLAAMHLNENSNKTQKFTKGGEPCFNITFPKAKRGEYSVRKIKEKSSYEYVGRLMKQVVQDCQNTSSYVSGIEKATELLNTPPPSLCSNFIRPNKSNAASNFKSRYTV